MTPDLWLYCAAGLSLLTLVAHVFGGGKSVARPLLDSDLGNEAKFTNYYCWHMVTLIIAFMGMCFFLNAQDIASTDLSIGATILAALFTLWSILLTLWKQQRVMTLPQWILFLPIAITGTLGVF